MVTGVQAGERRTNARASGHAWKLVRPEEDLHRARPAQTDKGDDARPDPLEDGKRPKRVRKRRREKQTSRRPGGPRGAQIVDLWRWEARSLESVRHDESRGRQQASGSQ